MALALRRYWGAFARAGPPVCFDRVPRAQTGHKSRPSAGLADAQPIPLVARLLDEYPYPTLSGRASVGRNSVEGRLRFPVIVFCSLQGPTFFMRHAVMRPAEQRQVGQGRRAALCPPDQVMSIAPGKWSRAARKNTVPVARLERPPGRRRQRPAGVIELVLELALAGDPADRRVAGIALHGLGRHGPATLELARRRALGPGERVDAGTDDQLRPRTGAVAFAA